MFSGALEAGRRRGLGLLLGTPIPLEVRLIDMDGPAAEQDGRRTVAVDDLRSVPLKAFWKGVEEEGWPAHARPVNLSGFVSVVTTQMGTGSRQDFAETSFALLSAQYMLLSLHLGYHFTTFESLCTPEPSKNYIRMQFKGGGASADRRARRIRLVMDLLSRMGFEHASRGDFLDSSLSYVDEATIADRLRLLGRLTMLTKQLDMALSNDRITEWYAEDFARKLGLEDAEGGQEGVKRLFGGLLGRAGLPAPPTASRSSRWRCCSSPWGWRSSSCTRTPGSCSSRSGTTSTSSSSSSPARPRPRSTRTSGTSRSPSRASPTTSPAKAERRVRPPGLLRVGPHQGGPVDHRGLARGPGARGAPRGRRRARGVARDPDRLCRRTRPPGGPRPPPDRDAAPAGPTRSPSPPTSATPWARRRRAGCSTPAST